MWFPIATAPKDGTPVLLRNARYSPRQALAWNGKRKRWEGVAFTPLKAVAVEWDAKEEPPTEWRTLS